MRNLDQHYRPGTENRKEERVDMEHTELKSNSSAELVRFVESHIPCLDQFRIEIIKDSNGFLIAGMVSRQAEAAPPIV
jgi:hypothetical protein